MSDQPLSIDILRPQKSHIDLSDKQLPSDFGMDDYKLSKLYDDVILMEFCDVIGDETGSEYILRGSIAIPISQVHNAWRKGKVILTGPNVRQTNVGDIVVFPNNMGILISNLEVTGFGKVKSGVFLNEQRMFGVCEINENRSI